MIMPGLSDASFVPAICITLETSFFPFGLGHPGNTQRLFLDLCLGMIPGCAQTTICSTGDLNQSQR